MNTRLSFLLFGLVFLSNTACAENINTWMVTDNKINVVVTVAFVVLSIMAVWLFRIETRLGKIERQSAQTKS
ncbi:MAG: hypothetical protein LW707_06805 [Sphingobacteriales bacterium]|jgi:hypothetical protein|nr:hypothetical protein [Sphingobacteriales bacterium]